MHYSYLNAHYNNAVNNDWQDGGCMDAIKRNLGYRLVLKEATLPDQASRGAESLISLNLVNNGYAAPFNARPLRLILRNRAATGLTDRWFRFPFSRMYVPGIRAQYSSMHRC